MLLTTTACAVSFVLEPAQAQQCRDDGANSQQLSATVCPEAADRLVLFQLWLISWYDVGSQSPRLSQLWPVTGGRDGLTTDVTCKLFAVVSPTGVR